MRSIAIGPGRSSPRVRMACARFGLRLTHMVERPPVAPGHLEALNQLEAGVALVHGRSGSGKSSLLNAFVRQRRLGGEGVVVVVPGRTSGRVIDVLEGSIGDALATLARVGLADATILARRVRDLSEGERVRLALASAILSSEDRPHERRGWIVIDEFLAVIDRPTARAVAGSVRRIWDRRGQTLPRLLVATAHNDLTDALRADLVVNLDNDPVEGSALQPSPLKPSTPRQGASS
ncbi:MAG: hypothetical protein K2Y21_00130 [Phycisphaerales bacterium]|nr:hypothetical protein [Phycisphaerales bacterium]